MIDLKMCLIGTVLFALLSAAIGAGIPQYHRGRIFGGTDAAPGQFPFAVAINTSNAQICGGVIVDHRWILTAAHCGLLFHNETSVIVGDVSLSNGTAYKIRSVFPHEDFDFSTLRNDVALIELFTEIISDDNQQPIDIGETSENQTCTVVGWGKKSPEVDHSDILQYLETNIINQDECKDIVSWDGFYFGPETACSLSDEGKSLCSGDDGGALVCDGKLAGIFTYTLLNCGENPMVYARASSYVEWMENIIHPLPTDITSTTDGTTSALNVE